MDIGKRLDRMEGMLELVIGLLNKMANPASTLSVQEKASAIRKALETGDKNILKQTMKEINGE